MSIWKHSSLEARATATLDARRHDASERIALAAGKSLPETLAWLDARLGGLSEREVAARRAEFGSNAVSRGRRKGLARRLADAFVNPFTAILFALAVVSSATDMAFPALSLFGSTPDDFDPLTVVIITTMVLLSGTLRFVQEARSGNAADRLLDMITTTCTVSREGAHRVEVALDEVVVGDIVHMSAGDMVPADVRVIEAKDLFVSQSSLSGESEPVEKTPACTQEPDSPLSCEGVALMGSSVVSGSAVGVVFAVGDRTLFGTLASSLSDEPVETSFSKGVNGVSWVLIRFMLVMVPFVFMVNGLTKGDWLEAGLFAVSIAVGLTPEMLPMIVTTCLAKGAVAMSKEKTIVKNLNSIQNFGAMDVLCTDKTGTLTQDRVVLEYHWNVDGEEDARVLRHAYLNSRFQTGYRNLMDQAIIAKVEELQDSVGALAGLADAYEKVDEIPFDFERRRLSTVVCDAQGKTQMVTKGAVEEMLDVCAHVEVDGRVESLDATQRERILRTVDALNDDGFRVLAVAQKSDPSPVGSFSVADERDMVLIGYLAFLDPPKESSARALAALAEHGVSAKILTGDNERVARTVCRQVGIEVDTMLLGSDVASLSDEELAVRAEETQVFAKLSPDQKARIVGALRASGHVVGFMGDGINDAAAMKSSDIGISVDSAVDVAKESADVILLEKDLMVLERGILEGRRTYANMIKYIKMTASSNFGNMFSVLAASALLPFLPMESIHLILLNLIYDCSCLAIPWDNVDEEFVRVPRAWDASSVGRFMAWIGPTSSLFDFLTYVAMYFVVCPAFVSHGVLYSDLASYWSGDALAQVQFAYMALFQAGWFVESMWSQTLVIHMIRTPKIPFLQSRASVPVTALTMAGIVALTCIPFSPLGPILGFGALPVEYFLFLVPCILLYMVLATCVKKAYVRRYGELL